MRRLPIRRKSRSGTTSKAAVAECLEARTMLAVEPLGPPVNVGAGDVSMDAAGNYVVVWSAADDIYAQLFDASGAARGAPLLVHPPTSQLDESWPSVGMAPDGDFVVAWTTTSHWVFGAPQDIDVDARRFAADGTPLGDVFRVNPATTGDHSFPAVSATPAGGFVIAWWSSQVWSFAQRYGADGAARGGLILVGVHPIGSGTPRTPAIAVDADGGFVIALSNRSGWQGMRLDVTARRYTSAGAPVGNAFRVNTTDGIHLNADVAIGPDGNFVITWTEYRDLEPSAILARRYNGSGVAQGPQVRISSNGHHPSVAMDAQGNSVIAWQRDAGIFALQFDAGGAARAAEVPLISNGSAQSLAMRGNGDFVLAWYGGHRQFRQFFNPASAGDLVWLDRNEDGVQDPDEPGVDGVTVNRLTEGGLLVNTTVTQAGGKYLFDDLRPGAPYYLEFIPPWDMVFTDALRGPDRALDSDADPRTGLTGVFSLAEDATDLGLDAGLTRAGEIFGQVFHDVDGDAAWDVGEPSLHGQTLFLDMNRNGVMDESEPSTMTMSDGFIRGALYEFGPLRLGTYRVGLIRQDGWVVTTPTTEFHEVRVTAGESTRADFGTRELAHVTVGDVRQSEGDRGLTAFSFTVTRSDGVGVSTVDFATASGTARAGSDYVRSAASVTFSPGETTRTVVVHVRGDRRLEHDEAFSVSLSNPVNAVIEDGEATGTIINDDPAPPPRVRIDDVSVFEGAWGTRTMEFTVRLSHATDRAVSVRYATLDGSASAGSDYVPRRGTLTFRPFQTELTITVVVRGDRTVEPDETLLVQLLDPVHAIIDRVGVGTIRNDDIQRT